MSKAGISDGIISSTSIALDADGVPYIALSEEITNSYRGMVLKYNGIGWDRVDYSGFANTDVYSPSIVINKAGMPYVAYRGSLQSNFKAVVKNFRDNRWWEVGFDGLFPGEGGGISVAGDFPSIVLDKNGLPYVAVQDETNSNRLTVLKFDGFRWSVVGTAGISAGVAYNPSLKLDANDVPYVAYQDGAKSGKISVAKFNGTDWVFVGNDRLSDDMATEPSLAIDAAGTPYVAYSEGTNKAGIVKKYNGSAWEDVGTTKFAEGGALTISLVIDATGVPYVAYRDYANGNKATLRKFNGTTWEQVGAAISAGAAYYPSLAIDAYGTPYVAFQDGANGDKATVMKFVPAAPVITSQPVSKSVAGDPSVSFTVETTGEGTLRYQWQVSQDGGISFVNIRDGLGYAGATTPALTISKASIYMDGYKYRVLINNGSVITSNVATLTVSMQGHETATVWQVVGAPGFSSSYGGYPKIVVAPDGTPYAAFADASAGGSATVMKFNGKQWELVGSAGFSGRMLLSVTTDQLSFTIAANGTPYVAFTDESNASKATVMKFNGTEWVTVGAAGFTPWLAYDPALVIDAKGTPYLAFNEGGATVMKFDGTAWVVLGNSKFNDNGSVSGLDMAFDASGLPYVVFSEYGHNAGKGKVMKFDGTSWVTIGSGSFSNGEAKYTSLELDATGTPYVGFVDVADNNKAKVIKFNGTDWITVGAASMPGYHADRTYLALDANGVPYLSFTNKESRNYATVIKFNGTEWEIVGNTGFSGNQLDDFSLSPDGIPYVIFFDSSNRGRATVMNFSTNNAPTDIALVNPTIDENIGDGVVVSGFITTDADVGDTHTYTLVPGEGANDNGYFTISNNALKLWYSPDYEFKSSYRIRVRTSDGKVNGFFEKALVLQVNDLDEIAPANYKVAFNQSLITYNTKSDVTITVTEAEVGATYNYTITSSGGGTPVTGAGEVATAAFDISSIDVTPLSDGQLTVALTLTDEFKNTGTKATAQTTKNTRYVIGAARPASVRVPFLTTFAQASSSLPATVEATYLDGRREPLPVTWNGDTYKGTEAGVYELIGTLTLVKGTINPDNINTYILVEVAQSKAPTAILISKNTIAENSAVGTIIGEFSTNDPDAGDEHTYKLVDGDGDTDNALFTIEGNVLKSAQIFDFETQSSFSIRIQTKDMGGMTFETSKLILVTDVYEAPTGIADEHYAGLKLYPNPASQYLSISSDKLIESVSLVNSQGKVVLTKRNRSMQLQLNTETYAPGVYTVLVTSQGKIYSRRIVIVR
ncbi:T9SS type A sorting domain-containing protein [Pontibacter burrus]|uniref:T9SS type A sorting domain-containing protein n=1 Tax=Pontibacter burrus TaxID=2704466 RepID=A0A6B3LHN4_9BACT|nr:T9SS type A sorting domain-containing protein [Pontibacter burrus]NEM96089.1 T9SS type A sorting domain-containing protein [Pontibacter burrus]